MRPCDVNESNERQVFKNTYGVKTLRQLLVKNKPKTDLSVDQHVRIKHKFNPFDKGYYPNWTDHIYKVQKVIKGNGKPLYTITDWDGDSVEKRFYPEELQKVKESTYRIEKIIRKKRENGQNLCLVKWLHFPNTYNSWVPESEVVDV